MKKELAPSLLSADFGDLRRSVNLVLDAGVSILHVDCMDNHFVPNLTFGPCVLTSIKDIQRAIFDVHLMVDDPASLVKPFAEAGAGMISVHIEADPHIHRTLSLIRSLSMKAGIAINPGTSLSTLDEVLPWCDFVLIMSVNPGFAAQDFISTSLAKITQLKKTITEKKLSVLIEVDGGIKRSNVATVLDAGADIVVAGSAIFGADDPAAEVVAFQAILNHYQDQDHD